MEHTFYVLLLAVWAFDGFPLGFERGGRNDLHLELVSAIQTFVLVYRHYAPPAIRYRNANPDTESVMIDRQAAVHFLLVVDIIVARSDTIITMIVVSITFLH